MTGTKLPREMHTPERREQMAAMVALWAEDAAKAAGTHVDYASGAADNGDADMAREHAADAQHCFHETQCGVEYLRAIGVSQDGNGYNRTVEASSHAYEAMKAARAAYESAACNAEPQLIAGRDYDGTAAGAEDVLSRGRRYAERAKGRFSDELPFKDVPQTPYEHGPRPPRKDAEAEAYEHTERLCWMRLLYLLRDYPDDIAAAVRWRVIPENIADDAARILFPPNTRPYGWPDGDEPFPF